MDTKRVACALRTRNAAGGDPEHVGSILPRAICPSARELRGIALFEEHGNRIRFEDGVWLVPSQHGGTSVYEVVIGLRGDVCECSDFVEPRRGKRPGDPCKHIIAATIARAKTAPCSGCGSRFRHRELTEVTEEHASLTWFEGDRLCECCLDAHGGIS